MLIVVLEHCHCSVFTLLGRSRNAVSACLSLFHARYRAIDALLCFGSALAAQILMVGQYKSGRASAGRIGEVGPPQGVVPSSLSPYSHYVLNGESRSARLTATAVKERGFSR